MNKYDKQHLRNLQRYEAMITALFDAAAKDAAKLSSLINGIGDAPFSWADYPLAKAKIDDIVAQLNSEVFGAVVNGVRSEWSLSNSKNNFLVQTVLGSNADSLPEAVARRYFNNNETAREAFLLRKESGLGLSDNVWRYTNQFKSEIEMALDIGIRSGKSADEISRDVRDYLKYPDKLFRRVRDEHGQLHLSQRASEFHPGRGVYRSSYMNARRLAATETNIAYRTADHLRWQELDFVVGIEIHLSNNHNCKGVPAGTYFDICDELQGRYPKDFKFTGWHPHCRCWVETILKTEAEMAEDNARIMAGEDVSESSENAVDALPSNFTAWRENNAERIERAKNLPYFLRDNQRLIDEGSAFKWKDVETEEKIRALSFEDNSRRVINAISKPYDDYLKKHPAFIFDDYTTGSEEINSVARFGKLLKRSYNSNDVELWKEVIQDLEKEIDRMPRLGQNVDMFRSSNTLGSFDINGLSLSDLNGLIGKKFTDKGFTSFSLSENYASQVVDSENKSGVTIVLKAKKGTKGACLANTSAYNEAERQEEFLLQRGSTFEVLGAKLINGRKYLFVSLCK